ncbi:hypothetical protein BKM31_23365 [[Actinomadura] parvosata subsp. kistnae]|uniref:Secreted protein n=1 Tax=[Actinomadura] parvosata subsp. kistnae TaxID=1909395 RepID=A0A1V0A1E2_9ACTN|nr:hypothetical protein [Nonomuraea sp. ATCC 55076]AQZ64007.1 hypothetical protein BKM31_23365 [Nonomuraea sp. ATCC 55076]
MNTIRRSATGTLTAAAMAAAALLTPGAAAAETPFAQASATIEADGSVAESKHVDDVWHPSRGVYCVLLNQVVDLDGEVAIHVTPIGRHDHPRSLSVERGARACVRRDLPRSVAERTIAVYSQAGSRWAAETAFYLTVS